MTRRVSQIGKTLKTGREPRPATPPPTPLVVALGKNLSLVDLPALKGFQVTLIDSPDIQHALELPCLYLFSESGYDGPQIAMVHPDHPANRAPFVPVDFDTILTGVQAELPQDRTQEQLTVAITAALPSVLNMFWADYCALGGKDNYLSSHSRLGNRARYMTAELQKWLDLTSGGTIPQAQVRITTDSISIHAGPFQIWNDYDNFPAELKLNWLQEAYSLKLTELAVLFLESPGSEACPVCSGFMPHGTHVFCGKESQSEPAS